MANLEWQKQCYGMTEEEIEKGLNDPIAALSGKPMVAMSILSDAQELLEMGQAEKARQHINRAKYIIGTYWLKVERPGAQSNSR